MGIKIKAVSGYAMIAAAGLVAAFLVYKKSETDYRLALENYQSRSKTEAQTAVANVQDALTLIYQNIRTISFLPSVQKIDRHGKDLDADALLSIQQIYNNLASNVAVSEVYIVPVDLNPDAIDPETKEPEVPILMFDQLIVGPKAGEAEEEKAGEAADQGAPVEEEIYEYHQLQKHMAWFKQNYPTVKTFKGLDAPMISGESVITCDNTEFDKSRNDEDRKGIMFSVPFYGTDGVLKGTVTAVVRNNPMKDLLPARDFALLNPGYDYSVLSREEGQERKSGALVAEAKTDPSLIYSEVLPIETADPQSKWLLWAGYPNERFTNSAEVRAVRQFRSFGYGLSALLAMMACVVLAVVQKAFRVVNSSNEQLETRIEERTREIEKLAREQEESKARAEEQRKAVLREMADGFESTVMDVVASLVSVSTQMQASSEEVAGIAEDTKQRSTTVTGASEEAVGTTEQVALAAEELTASIAQVREQIQKSSDVVNEATFKTDAARQAMDALSRQSNKVGEIVETITDIAGQINMLALNATIESARAGEAGKGFAVVANEVKGLANQVARAADEITKQVGEMQGATRTSVGAVNEIASIIDRVLENSQTVTESIEQQSVATREIARNMAVTAEGTREISRNIQTVQQGAEKTGDSVREVLLSAKDLATTSHKLKEKVDGFLATVRAA